MNKYLVIFQSIVDGKKIVYVQNAKTEFAAERDAWLRLEESQPYPKEKFFLYSRLEIDATLRKEDIDKLIEEHGK